MAHLDSAGQVGVVVDYLDWSDDGCWWSDWQAHVVRVRGHRCASVPVEIDPRLGCE